MNAVAIQPNVLSVLPHYGTPISVNITLPDGSSSKVSGVYMGIMTCDTAEDFDTDQHIVKSGDIRYALSANEISGRWELVGTHITKKAEKDIEVIPAGTIVWNIKSGEVSISNAKCYIDGRQRNVLVYMNNLLQK